MCADVLSSSKYRSLLLFREGHEEEDEEPIPEQTHVLLKETGPHVTQNCSDITCTRVSLCCHPPEQLS